MLSTYYIYYIVTKYYVVNGITIIKYLHNGNYYNGGKGWYIATLCATVKRVCVCVASCYAAYHARSTLLAMVIGHGNATLLRSTLSRSSIGFGTRLVCAPFASSTKKNMCFPV